MTKEKIIKMYIEELRICPCVLSYKVTGKTKEILDIKFKDEQEYNCKYCKSQFCFKDCEWTDIDNQNHNNKNYEGMFV